MEHLPHSNCSFACFFQFCQLIMGSLPVCFYTHSLQLHHGSHQCLLLQYDIASPRKCMAPQKHLFRSCSTRHIMLRVRTDPSARPPDTVSAILRSQRASGDKAAGASSLGSGPRFRIGWACLPKYLSVVFRTAAQRPCAFAHGETALLGKS